MVKEKRCPIIVSGGDPIECGITESDAMEKVLINLGVPTLSIYKEQNSLTTVENALRCRELCRIHQWNEIWLVTNDWHLPRAVALFETICPDLLITGIAATSEEDILARIIHERAIIRSWINNQTELAPDIRLDASKTTWVLSQLEELERTYTDL